MPNDTPIEEFAVDANSVVSPKFVVIWLWELVHTPLPNDTLIPEVGTNPFLEGFAVLTESVRQYTSDSSDAVTSHQALSRDENCTAIVPRGLSRDEEDSGRLASECDRESETAEEESAGGVSAAPSTK